MQQLPLNHLKTYTCTYKWTRKRRISYYSVPKRFYNSENVFGNFPLNSEQ